MFWWMGMKVRDGLGDDLVCGWEEDVGVWMGRYDRVAKSDEGVEICMP
jgi:hypothetical protein